MAETRLQQERAGAEGHFMKFYTTGEVGRLCSVAPATVIKWIDSGELVGFRLPGSRHRRILHQDLLEFLERNRIPHPGLERAVSDPVLLVTGDTVLAQSMREALMARGFALTVAHDGFDAGMTFPGVHPVGVVVDFSIGATTARRLCEHLRDRIPAPWRPRMIALVGDRGLDIADLADDVFLKPFDPALLAARMRSMNEPGRIAT